MSERLLLLAIDNKLGEVIDTVLPMSADARAMLIESYVDAAYDSDNPVAKTAATFMTLGLVLVGEVERDMEADNA